jgi:hypothetical protein
MVLKAPQQHLFLALTYKKKLPLKYTEHTRKELCTPKRTSKYLYKKFLF